LRDSIFIDDGGVAPIVEGGFRAANKIYERQTPDSRGLPRGHAGIRQIDGVAKRDAVAQREFIHTIFSVAA
jgi:hypothetical protein